MDDWVILQLTPKGEKENPDAVRKSIAKSLHGAEVYIPAIETTIGDDTVTHYLMNGYAFARKEDGVDYFRLEGGKYVETVLVSTPRKVATVPQSYIEEMQEKIRAEVNQGIGVGDVVRICSGPYKNIEATVITEIPEQRAVQVHVQLRSKAALLTLPRSVLNVVDRAPLSPYFARLGYLRAWAQMARVVLRYQGSHERVQGVHQQFQQVSQWLWRAKTLFNFVHASSLDGRQDVLGEKMRRLEEVSDWLDEGRRLYSFIFFESLLPKEKLGALHEKYQQLLWFQGVDDKLRVLSQEVEEIARAMARRKKGEGEMEFQNVVVDGHNLAFRCLYAPGMSELRDTEGRPTGVILGFLRSLGALKKRHPEAKFWVSWDGSSKRRKAKYPDYKANRKTQSLSPGSSSEGVPVFDQMAFLREILPLLGVRQVWNPDEEADDVIATLVRGELESQKNLLVSTDRDFLQLVTESTMLLVPAGARKEALYDMERVESVMGVPPAKVLQLRAFFGDTSDNLPGVPRVPKKTMTALVQSYGSVDDVYSSGLAGVSKAQYERLRIAEPQVRLNLTLMAFTAVDVVRSNPDVDVKGAATRLSGLNIKPDPITEAFFGKVGVLRE